MQLIEGATSSAGTSSCSIPNGGAHPGASDSVECIDLDDEIARMIEMPTMPAPELSPAEVIKENVRSVLETFVFDCLRKHMTPKERMKVRDQVWNAFEKVNFATVEVGTEVKEFVDEIVKLAEEKPKAIWRIVEKLLDFMKSKRASLSKKQKQNKNKPEDETPEERIERKKGEKIIKLEKQLARIEKQIAEYDQKEVDLQDEKNSSYLVRTRMINAYMKHYKLLCSMTGCNHYTGRPIEKRIKLQQGITKCAEVTEAVEKFMNNKHLLFIPDYHDIKKVVADFNAQARPPPLCDSEIENTAKELFNHVIRILRNRRRQDFEIVCPVESTSDPAETDEDLQKKLEENVKLRKSEHEIFEKFVKEQEESQEAAQEVEDDPASSAGESDDEDEAEDLNAEQGSNSGSDEPAAENQEFTRDQVEDEESDSTESEDEEPPPKRKRNSSKSPSISPKKSKQEAIKPKANKSASTINGGESPSKSDDEET
jgi:hypothetical protein